MRQFRLGRKPSISALRLVVRMKRLIEDEVNGVTGASKLKMNVPDVKLEKI